MDPLSDLLQGVRARAAAFCRTIWDPPWSLQIADGSALALITPLRGHTWIVRNGSDPVLVATGDIAIVKGSSPYLIGDEPTRVADIMVRAGNRLTRPDGTDVTDAFHLGPRTTGRSLDGSTIVASGTYQIGNDLSGRLLSALPDIVHVTRVDAQNPALTFLVDEIATDGAGQQVMLDRLLDIALVSTLRAWFDHPETQTPGWYRAHTDPVAGYALRLMHEDPKRPWTIARLAEATSCSRASLARRFTALVGEPPMSYLANWRIALAADLLSTSNLTIEAIANRVGYSNAFALSVAFKRIRGISPTQYRAGNAFEAQRT